MQTVPTSPVRVAEGFPNRGSTADKLLFALRYAAMAPSSHNTQPWLFRVARSHVAVSVDTTRHLRIADADQRELFASLGCAIENLVIALQHFGMSPDVTLFPLGESRPVVAWVSAIDTPTTASPALFDAIPTRATHRGKYEPRPLSAGEIALLDDAARQHGMEIAWMTDADDDRRRVLEDLTQSADALQFADPRWRHELAGYIRSGAFGQKGMKARLGAFVYSHFDLGRSTARKDHELLASAPACGILWGGTARRTDRVRAGRALQRLWLTAEALGLRVHPMNQALQLPELATDVAVLAGGTPHIVFRIGFAPPVAHVTPRRPLEEVLEASTVNITGG